LSAQPVGAEIQGRKKVSRQGGIVTGADGMRRRLVLLVAAGSNGF
jgi:hypothetical protein